MSKNRNKHLNHYFCPNEDCDNHDSPAKGWYIKKGYYKLKHNHQPVPRYQCKLCKRKFSSQTFKDTHNQKKPFLNDQIFQFYSSAMTQRRLAKTLKCNRKTIVRKFLFLANKAQNIHEEKLKKGEIKTSYVQFDEMETYESTKLKPVSIALAVRPKTGEILGIDVGSMKAKGHLADRYALKYSEERQDTRDESRTNVLDMVALCAKESVTIASDAHPSYEKLFRKAVPHAEIKQIPQGKQRKFGHAHDELFMINHTCALLRQDLSRLRRRTWITTKDIERLKAHLWLYVAYRNGYDLCRFVI